MNANEKLVAEGKTKQVFREMTGTARIVSKDDITGGNGAKHDILKGKAVWATTTTCNVFELLRREGVPVAFLGHIDETAFRADMCRMLPLEVVVRGEAHGSYVARTGVARGTVFHSPKVEFYLKTTGRRWREHDLPCDDPRIEVDRSSSQFHLFDPSEPEGGHPFLSINFSDVFPVVAHTTGKIAEMEARAQFAFKILRDAWKRLGYNLVDIKFEFGECSRGLVIADVVDNDSWRLLKNGEYMDKQVYRDGKVDPKLLAKVRANYKEVAEASARLIIR